MKFMTFAVIQTPIKAEPTITQEIITLFQMQWMRVGEHTQNGTRDYKLKTCDMQMAD